MDAPRRPSGGGDDDDATTARATTTTGASDGSEKYVSAATRARLRARGIDELNAMQLAVCEAAVGRRADATCRAPTGSGKTLAYVLPIAKMLERAARDGSGGGGGGGAVRAMVVTPTRELASQVRTQCERYCGEGSSALCVGGASAKAQEDAIRKGGAKIVVGTPGRMKEFIDRGVIEPRAVEIQVLDEIDRLLDGGFEGEIDAVMRPPGTCQTLCFSATISAALSRFLDRKLVPGYAEVVVAGRGGSNVGGMVEHLAYATKSGDDAVGSAVVDALEHYAGEHVDGRVGGQAIVFTETKSTAERVRAMLTNMLTTEFDTGKRTRRVASLHGDLPQPARDATLANLRSGEVDVLVATDVAARGLDLPGVELVVHADMPKSADTYSHRAGRAGRPGCAVPGVSLLISRPELASEITRLEREAKVSIRRLVFIGERERVVVTGDLGASVSTLGPESRESAPARRDDSLIADHFARFADDIQNIATSKKKGKSKSRGK